VTKKVRPRRCYDLLSTGIGLAISQPRLLCAFHVSLPK
jgi:hypothetical protein